MISEKTMRAVLKEHVDAENAHDRARVLATYVERGAEFVDVPTGNVFRDGDEIVANYTNLWDGLPNLVRRIDRWAFGENTCVIELTLSGRHEGVYRGLPPTGRAVELKIAAHFEFDENGRIVRETAYYDALTFMRQMGIGREQRTADRGQSG